MKLNEELLEEIYSYTFPMQATTFWDKVFASKLGCRDKDNIYFAYFAHYIHSIVSTVRRDEAKKRGEDDPITGESFEDLSDIAIPFDEAAKTFIDNLNVYDYRRPFMTEEEVKAFNDERKQHLKDKIKEVDEEIEKNKYKPVNFPKDVKYKSEMPDLE